jgi:hypothetical protein
MMPLNGHGTMTDKAGKVKRKTKFFSKRLLRLFAHRFPQDEGLFIDYILMRYKNKTAQPNLVHERLARAQSNNFDHAVSGAPLLLLSLNWRFIVSNS